MHAKYRKTVCKNLDVCNNNRKRYACYYCIPNTHPVMIASHNSKRVLHIQTMKIGSGDCRSTEPGVGAHENLHAKSPPLYPKADVKTFFPLCVHTSPQLKTQLRDCRSTISKPAWNKPLQMQQLRMSTFNFENHKTIIIKHILKHHILELLNINIYIYTYIYLYIYIYIARDR